MSFKKIILLPLLACLLFLTACKVTIYTDIDENTANDMLVLLLDNGVDAARVDGTKSPMQDLTVESDQIAQALDILQSQGYPKETFTNLGDLFAKQGLISSPTEERVRFIYGVSQQLAETITQIDGVIVSRVNVVIPEANVSTQITEPASASVLIKYNRAYDLESQVPQIKLLITNAVEGLTYEKVSVVLFPAQDAHYGKNLENYKPTYAKAMSVNYGNIKSMLSTLIATLLILGGGIFIYTQLNRKKETLGKDEFDEILK